MVGGIRSQILDFLYRNPGDHSSSPSGEERRYWTARGIARAIDPDDPHESSVWKVIAKFRKCGLLEDRPPARVPSTKRVVKDAWGNPIERTRARVFRSEVPCRLSTLGRRVAELMGFAREQGVFKLEPQRRRITQNQSLLARFKQAGFTEDELEAAMCSGVIYERPIKSYTPEEGMIDRGAIAAAFRPRVRYVEIRYKYALR
jgi:hypothetical protein